MHGSHDIGLAGEKAAAEQLEEKNWRITRWDTTSPGATDIEAQSGAKKVLVQVKSAVVPNEPASLSVAEERNIKSRATGIGAEAWEARVQLDELLSLVAIKWRKLN